MTFFDNPVIQKLAYNPRWTINVDGKMPLNIQALKTQGQIFGATGEHCLTTLSDLLTVFATHNTTPTQFTYFLDARRDGIVILDIEPSCDDNLKHDFLNLDFLYGDISASGRGYHLAFPCPPLDDITSVKKVMKHPEKSYEILLCHYVTFTKNIILPTATPSTTNFQAIWNELAAMQKVSKTLNISVTVNPQIERQGKHKLLHEKLTEAFQRRFVKKPVDYNNDMSRYEFGAIGSVRMYLEQLLKYSLFEGVTLDESEKIRLVYDVLVDNLPHRDKHDEFRSGQPFLFYQVCKSFETTYET